MASSGAWAEADDVLLTVGERQLTLAQAQQMALRMHAELGAGAPTADKARERFVTEQLVARLVVEAQALKTLKNTEVGKRLRDAALNAALERQLLAQASVTEEEIAAFYAEHRQRYVAPEAIAVWRILVPDASLAERLLKALQGRADGAALWGEFVRKHSADKATSQRGGSLGFVRPNGHTDVPQVRVSAEVFEAVSKVDDGQLVPQPVPVGDYHAVLWRRGTRPARTLSLKEAAPSIRQILERHEAQRARAALTARLRSEQVSDYQPELIEAIEYPPLESIPAAKLPLRARAAEADPLPKPRARGER